MFLSSSRSRSAFEDVRKYPRRREISLIHHQCFNARTRHKIQGNYPKVKVCGHNQLASHLILKLLTLVCLSISIFKLYGHCTRTYCTYSLSANMAQPILVDSVHPISGRARLGLDILESGSRESCVVSPPFLSTCLPRPRPPLTTSRN